jgi:chromosomal replication initiator protein
VAWLSSPKHHPPSCADPLAFVFFQASSIESKSVMSSFWNHCLNQFEQELPPQQFNTWIRPLRLEGEDLPDKGLCLVAPNGFILNWVKDRYLKRVEDLAQLFFSAPIHISLTVGIQKTPAFAGQERIGPALHRPVPAAAGTLSAQSYEKTRLSPRFTFDNLVVGRANDLARAAAQNVAANPGSSRYNPLFIYGGSGLGKTHLIHAIGNHIARQTPDRIIRYVHAADYFSDVVRATKTDSFDTFKRYYQSLDVLLLDDVQYLGKKFRTQEELFFVFNALIETNKQIVITCDTYPRDISEVDDRLITRFDWGLTVQIEPPEIEMRVAILEKKAEAEGVVLGDEVAFYVAKHIRSNVRELEGALNKIFAYASFRRQKINLELVKEALKDLIGAVNSKITVENIQKTVADYFKIKAGDLVSKKRSRPIARPRQIAMWLAKNLTSESLSEIGKAFGGRDHSTVINAVERVDELREKDNRFGHDVNLLLQILKGPE